MRFTFTLLVLSAAVSTTYAAIITRQDVPTCVQACVESGLSATSCNTSDDACLCTDSTFINTVSSCMEASCSAADIQAAEAAFQQVCSAAGVTSPPLPSPSA